MSSTRFRRVALGLPEVIEASHQGHADFRVGKRIFATLGHPSEDWGMVKLMREQQTVLVEAEPDIFRPVPGGWGKQGYTNVRLAAADKRRFKVRSPWHGPTSRRNPCSKRMKRRRASAASCLPW
jgi:hypothetical protein